MVLINDMTFLEVVDDVLLVTYSYISPPVLC